MSELDQYVAADMGRNMGELVIDGLYQPEDVGEHWVRLANIAHELGEAFIKAYDATGAPR